MDDDELLELATMLESASNVGAAESKISSDTPWLGLMGNRHALIRFASAFLRAAAAKIPDGDCRADMIEIEHHQLTNAETDFYLGAVQRIDRFPENTDVIANRKSDAWRKDRASLICCGCAGFLFLFLLLSGVAFWWQLVTGTPLR